MYSIDGPTIKHQCTEILFIYESNKKNDDAPLFLTSNQIYIKISPYFLNSFIFTSL